MDQERVKFARSLGCLQQLSSIPYTVKVTGMLPPLLLHPRRGIDFLELGVSPQSKKRVSEAPEIGLFFHCSSYRDVNVLASLLGRGSRERCLKDLVESCPQTRILVFGSLLVTEYLVPGRKSSFEEARPRGGETLAPYRSLTLLYKYNRKHAAPNRFSIILQKL